MKYVQKQTEMSDDELAQKVNAMSAREQAHFKLLIHTLVGCYGDTAQHALVIVGHAHEGLAGVVSLNCDAMDGAKLMEEATNFFGHLNTYDAPPKEHFN